MLDEPQIGFPPSAQISHLTFRRSITSRPNRIRIAAIAAVAAGAAGVGTWLASGREHAATPPSTKPAVVTAVTRAGLLHAAAAMGRPVYWAGADHGGKNYELTATVDGRVYVRSSRAASQRALPAAT